MVIPLTSGFLFALFAGGGSQLPHTEVNWLSHVSSMSVYRISSGSCYLEPLPPPFSSRALVT